LLQPRHEGIEVLSLPDPAAPDCGCLAIWIERSDRRPHQSQAAKDRRYYKRAGDSTFVMEHYDIEDAFKRNAVAELELEVSSVRKTSLNSGGGREVQNYEIRFMLKNVSSVSARAPYVLLKQCLGGQAVPVRTRVPDRSGPEEVTLRRIELSTGIIFSGDAMVLIHPGLELPAFDMHIETVRQHGDSWRHNGVVVSTSGISLECGFGCEHGRMITRMFQWVGHELEQVLMRAP
jgi:hypothetical protein